MKTITHNTPYPSSGPTVQAVLEKPPCGISPSVRGVKSTPNTQKLTRSLLIGGIVAGPIYILVGSLEILTRPGFDMTRHDLSLMANGDWGWVHIALLIGTGLLTIGAAIGLWRALRGSSGGRWDQCSSDSTDWASSVLE